jgi:hypothetical protein
MEIMIDPTTLTIEKREKKKKRKGEREAGGREREE